MEEHDLIDDEDCDLIDVDDLSTIGNETHYGQIIDQYTAMRQDFAHDLAAYDLAQTNDAYNADVERLAEHMCDIYAAFR